MVYLLLHDPHLLQDLVLRRDQLLLLTIQSLLLGVEVPSDDLYVLLDGLQVTHQEEVLLLEVHEDVHQLGGVLEEHLLGLVLLLEELEDLRVGDVVVGVEESFLLLALGLGGEEEAVQELFVAKEVLDGLLFGGVLAGQVSFDLEFHLEDGDLLVLLPGHLLGLFDCVSCLDLVLTEVGVE